MPNCPACQTALPLLAERHGRYCPRCGADVEGADAQRWVKVARVSNLAELGFLEDVLADAGIEPRLDDDDNFDAVHGVWRGAYTISVRMSHADEAADLLDRHLGAAPETESAAHEQRAAMLPDPSAQSRPASWNAWVAWIVAGGIVYWGGSWLVQVWKPHRAAMERSDLTEALEALGRPLVTPGEDPPRAVLRTDRQGGTLVLEEDRDGDGRRETRREFRRGEQVRP